MKTGKTLTELAQELDRQRELKHDYVVNTPAVTVKTAQGGISTLELAGLEHMFSIGNICQRQINERLGIPAKYADRIRSQFPDLYDGNVNYLMKAIPESRMVRTLGDRARAFLSERYRTLDNYQLAEAVLPVLQEMEADAGLQIVSCEITEARMYIKAVFPRMQAEVKLNDPVQSGLVVSNSEIGLGAFRVEPLVYRLICLNGMIGGTALKRYHVGRAHSLGDDSEDAFEIFTDETREADDKAFWLKVRDTVRASADVAKFNSLVDTMRDATQRIITMDPLKVVERTQKLLTLNETERTSVLTHLLQGGDLSQYGLMNAITRTSQDVADYDRATELERAGGTIIELPQTQWHTLAEAA